MKIELGTLKDKGEDLSKFLGPRVGTEAKIDGSAIEIDAEQAKKGLKSKTVKTYVKRFLFMNGVREKYRVFVEGDQLTIQEYELSEEEKEKEEERKEKLKEAEKKEAEERKELPEPEAAPAAPAEEPKKEKTAEKPKKEKPKKKEAAAKKKPKKTAKKKQTKKDEDS